MQNNSYIKSILATIFDVKNNNKSSYNEKYIYFSSICDFEGGEAIGELKLIRKIANIVGKDNLLIKIHPRDVRDVYKKEGLKIDKSSSVPWEVIQLLYDFKDKVFLTATSSSVLMSNAITGKHIKSFYLYPACSIKNNYIATKVVNALEVYFNQFANKEIFENITVTDNLNDILN